MWEPTFQAGGSGEIKQGMGISSVTPMAFGTGSATRYWLHDNEPINHPIKPLSVALPRIEESGFSFLITQ